MSERIEHTLSCLGTTVGAVQQSLCGYDLPGTAGVATIELSVMGRDTGTGDAVATQRVLVFKHVGGVGVQVGSASESLAQVQSASLAGALVTVSIAGVTVSVLATGVVARTIDWSVVMRARTLTA